MNEVTTLASFTPLDIAWALFIIFNSVLAYDLMAQRARIKHLTEEYCNLLSEMVKHARRDAEDAVEDSRDAKNYARYAEDDANDFENKIQEIRELYEEGNGSPTMKFLNGCIRFWFK